MTKLSVFNFNNLIYDKKFHFKSTIFFFFNYLSDDFCTNHSIFKMSYVFSFYVQFSDGFLLFHFRSCDAFSDRMLKWTEIKNLQQCRRIMEFLLLYTLGAIIVMLF